MKIKIFTILSILCIFSFAQYSYADKPLSPPATYSVQSANKKYTVDINYEAKETVVYVNNQDGSRSELWKMPGWFRWVAVSNDGKYVVIPYGGLNLLTLNYKKDEVTLQIASEGKIIHTIKLDQLISDFNSLERTVSHYYWGDYLGFNDKNEYVIETVEKNKFHIGLETGYITREGADGGYNYKPKDGYVPGKESAIDASRAVAIAMDDLKKVLVKFPDKFDLIVNDNGQNISVSLIPGSSGNSVGGDLEITINKKSGVIIKRVAGQ